jgi:hypothetical protein
VTFPRFLKKGDHNLKIPETPLPVHLLYNWIKYDSYFKEVAAVRSISLSAAKTVVPAYRYKNAAHTDVISSVQGFHPDN